MSHIPRFLEIDLWCRITKRQAKEIWEWLQSNSNTVIVDELEATIRKRKDWSPKEE